MFKLAISITLIALLISVTIPRLAQLPIFARRLSTATTTTTTMSPTSTNYSSRGPVYFISHGGPPTMFDQKSAPYLAWKKLGERIRNDVRDGVIAANKGIVAVSAHWEADQSSGKVVQLNTNTKNPLIYDFYGFPRHFYAQTFNSSFAPEQVQDVRDALQAGGWQVDETNRGLDHGLWVPFKVAFQQEPVESMHPPAPSPQAIQSTPRIIQVSLPGDSSETSAERLGQSLNALRDQGYAIVATGQAVHNLRDIGYARGFGGPGKTAYGTPFLSAVAQVIAASPGDLGAQAKNLFQHPSYQRAHPTPEHLLPLVVAAGAVQGKQVDETQKRGDMLFQEDDGPLGWAMARWA